MSDEKKNDPLDATMKYVKKPDDIDPLQEDEDLVVEMSCGHSTTPGSLTGWCRSLLEEGQCKFTCPAHKPDGKVCGVELSYREVRRVAALTVDEMQQFEERLAQMTINATCKIKACPGCGTCVERKTEDNLCFSCPICKESNRPSHQFCWQCLRPWKGPAPRVDRCKNPGCVDIDLQLLKSCPVMELPEVRGVGPCPSIRACPTCGMKVEHTGVGCKNIICRRCTVEFCFVCLKVTQQCLQTSSYFVACSSGIAPRQTSIPKWKK
ncbi:hypothetical protein NHX12_014303 [Muraenolepis orangiensis]|uniref:RING-type domain-containing protein n=1 Tax=Muraenolepis orangiensis TaxID=630683 RepID=A0A9Q0DBV7_9TELE|nr:hypothetical protein NHX12_014303 [Muraenolepis orangiensis]